MQTDRLKYVLITPARNEEAFIEGAIKSVIAQTCRPFRWVIVSDGSTDKTEEIVERYTGQHPWIKLLRMPQHRDRHFAAKADCFNAGYGQIKDLDYDLVGNLDADITFGPDYYSFLVDQFAVMPRLGVAGTPFVEDFAHPERHSYAHKHANLNHVSGACQMFRKQCFVEVGGYTPIRGGGIDWVAVTTARMNGWVTKTFLDRFCLHHRKMGTASHGRFLAPFRHGEEDYYVGGHPLWQMLRSLFRMRERPFVVGGVLLMAGYLWAWAKRTPRPISKELVKFYRAEQMARLRQMFSPSVNEAPAAQPSPVKAGR